MPYESAYESFYTESPYNLEILKPRTAKRAWYQMSPLEKQRELGRQQTKLAGIPEVPPRMKRRRLKEAFQPMLNALKVFSVILNIPSTAVSSAVLQLMDGKPGFDTQEYFRKIFKYKEMASWKDIIEILAERDPNENVWDKKWAQIVGGLALDIALDPLTYFGYGIIKNLAGKMLGKKPIATALRELSDTAGGILAKQGLKTQANLVRTNIYNRGLKAWGFQLPFKTTVRMPLGRKGVAIREIAERFAKTPTEEVAKSLSNI